MPHAGSSLASVYGQSAGGACGANASLGACGTMGHCSKGGAGQFDWGFGYSSRALRTQGPACDPTSRARDFYSPCAPGSGSYMDQSGACAARTLEAWDDATVPDTINYVDTHFYQAPPSMRWNETWDMRGDVGVDVGKCLPVTGIPTRRSPRAVWGNQTDIERLS